MHFPRSFALLLCLLTPLSCGQKAKKEPKRELSKPEPAPPPDPVTQAVRTVVKACTITPLGERRDCTGPAEVELSNVEKQKGVIPSLMLHCQLAGTDDDEKVRMVAATRIGALGLHRALKQKPDAKLFDCLMGLLQGKVAKSEAWRSMRVIRAATFLGTAMEKEQLKRLLGYLDSKKTPLWVKQVGYECLWVNGRMKVFDQIEQAARSSIPALRRAAMSGFAYDNQLRKGETDKVCGLMGELMKDQEVELAGHATQQLARLCVGQRKAILDAVKKGAAKRDLPLGFVNALGLIGASANPPPTPAQRKLVLRLLSRVVGGRAANMTRLAALRQMERLEPIQAEKLEKRYKLKARAKKIAQEAHKKAIEEAKKRAEEANKARNAPTPKKAPAPKKAP